MFTTTGFDHQNAWDVSFYCATYNGRVGWLAGAEAAVAVFFSSCIWWG